MLQDMFQLDAVQDICAIISVVWRVGTPLQLVFPLLSFGVHGLLQRYQIGNGNCDTGKACDRLKSVENGHEAIKDGHFHSTSIRLPLADRSFDRRVVFLVNDIILQRTPTTSPTYCPGSQPPLLILHLSAPRLQSAYLALLFNDQLVPSRHTSRQIHLVPHQSSRPPSRWLVPQLGRTEQR